MQLSPNYAVLRQHMVYEQLALRGIDDQRVLKAMNRVPRHRFVPEALRHMAYKDGPLPIGNNQTISQPYIVALMTQTLLLTGAEIVLEIGTGSGYQTAILCELAQSVYSLERYPALSERASAIINEIGYVNLERYIGDGSQGLADMAPYDAIIVTAAAPAIPGPLRAQMAHGGRMIIPVGDKHHQLLQRVWRQHDSWEIETLFPVRFVPLYGRHGFIPPDDPRPPDSPHFR